MGSLRSSASRHVLAPVARGTRSTLRYQSSFQSVLASTPAPRCVWALVPIPSAIYFAQVRDARDKRCKVLRGSLVADRVLNRLHREDCRERRPTLSLQGGNKIATQCGRTLDREIL